MTMFTATTPRDIDAAPEYQTPLRRAPYLLEHLSRHRPPAAIARTLELDEQVRERRHRGALPERALVAPAGTLDRTISDAENTEELPGRTVRMEGQPPVQDVSVNEAYDGIGSVHAFLEEVYGSPPWTGPGWGCSRPSTMASAMTTRSGTGRRWCSGTATARSSRASRPRCP